MKRPKFFVENGPIPKNDDDNDAVALAQTFPEGNHFHKKSKNKCNIFNTLTITSKTRETLSSPLIWNKLETKINLYQMVPNIKKEFFNFLIVYINVILDQIGVNEKFVIIDEELIINTQKEFNINLFKSSLKYIFSTNVSVRNWPKYSLNHNAQLVKRLYENNNTKIINILNKTLFQCFEHFRKTKYIPELQGLECYFIATIGKLVNEKKDKEYIDYFISILNDFEYIYPINCQKNGSIITIPIDN